VEVEPVLDKMRVLLVGGPRSVREEDRVQLVTALSDKIKLCIYGGYEHFCHQGEYRVLRGERLPAFQWTARTAIAE
jgi:hypothetical protein